MYKTWYFDELAIHIDEVESILKSYNFPEWLLCHEEFNSEGKPKPHYHILVKLGGDGDIKPWNAMMSRFKNTYKLLQKNKEYRKNNPKGGYSCFGIIKGEIYDPETYKKYLCKDGNIRSNISPETLKNIMTAGQTVKRHKEFKIQCLKFVEAWYEKNANIFNKTSHCESTIKTLILDFYIQENAPWCKSSILSMYNYLISYSTNPQIKIHSDEIVLRLDLLSQTALLKLQSRNPIYFRPAKQIKSK